MVASFDRGEHEKSAQETPIAKLGFAKGFVIHRREGAQKEEEVSGS